MSAKDCRRKRFSDDQIRSLESTFETEARPELHLKQNLANRLGLNPRQVAIWFQNKRARSKSKQIEGDYDSLKSEYDHLASEMEAATKENQTLLIQVQRLRKMVEQSESKNHITIATSENPRLVLDMDENGRGDYLEEEYGVLNMGLPSPENGCSFQSSAFLHDNTGSASQWWEFK